MQKKNNKIRIFLFLAFGLVAAVFFVQVAQLTRTGINEINNRKDMLKCEHLEYSISDISYENNRLMFRLDSQDFDTNISKLTVITDKQDKKETILQSPIMGGDSQTILFKNASVEEKFSVYPNECEDIIEEYKIK